MTGAATPRPAPAHPARPGERALSDHHPGSPPLGAEALEDVLAAAVSGAPWAFERLYEELAPTVAGYLRLRGVEEPEELTNEVMLGVFRGLPRFEGDVERFRSWVFTIAYRRAIDARRRRSARPRTIELEPGWHDEPSGDVESEAMASLEDERLRALLVQLTESQREVIILRVVADLSVEQTAEVLGKQPGAVKMAQRRGLATLRRLVEEEGVTS